MPRQPDEGPQTVQPTKADVERQLDRILRHALFERAPRLGSFLRFAVESVLEGRSEQLKEYTIGVEVLGLGAAYNPQENPAVRVTAGRLRSKLAEYYLGAGFSDPVFIDIPRGTYAPRFFARKCAPAQSVRQWEPAALETVCVGREHEFERLRAAFAAMSGRGVMWNISGDAGIGKTTLANEFLADIERTRPSIRIGRGSGSERLAETDAFVPILECLHSLARGPSGTAAAEVLRTEAPTWHWRLQSDISHPGSAPRPVSHERMRREIIDLLRVLSRSGPVVWFLDDLHWADASTCDLLGYLGERLQGLEVFILMTHRPTAVVSPQNPFLRLMLDLERRGICNQLPLPFLSTKDVEGFVAARYRPNAFPAELGAFVHRRTEGHPLFMTALVRFLEDQQVIARRAGVWTVERPLEAARDLIPTGIKSLIRLKLDSLGEEDLRLLVCASVQGAQFDTAVVARALCRAPLHVELRFQELEAVHNLVQRIGERELAKSTVSVEYRFVHVFYQNALYASLTPMGRAEQSAAVAEALLALDPAAPPADVAVLLEAGRKHAEAALHFQRAARNAARLFGYPEAAMMCERGLRALAKAPPSEQRDTRELSLLLISTLALMASRGYAAPEVAAAHRRALELCRTLKQTRHMMPLLWGLHTCEVNAGNLDASLALALKMRETAELSREAAARIQSLHALGTTLAFMGRCHPAIEALEQIMAQPESAHVSRSSLYLLDPMVTSLSMLARLLALMGQVNRAVMKAGASVEFARQLAHPQSMAYATFWVGWTHHARGEHEQSLRHVESAMALSREHGLRLIFEWARVVRGSSLTHLGRMAEGIAEMRESVGHQQTMGSMLERAYCLTLLAEALARAGDAGQALTLCDDALAFGSQTGGRCYEAETHRVRGEVLLVTGAHKVKAAEAEFQTAIATAREHGCRLLELRAAGSYFRSGRKPGFTGDARQALAAALASFDESADCAVVAEARRLLGEGQA